MQSTRTRVPRKAAYVVWHAWRSPPVMSKPLLLARHFRQGSATRLCALVVLLAARSACAADTSPTATQPSYNVGDQWTFTNEKGIAHTQRVVDTAADTITVGIGKGRGQVNRDFNFPRTFNGRTTIDERVIFPLSVGREWSSSFEWKSGTIFGKTDIKRRVVAYERVRVPAGEFDAFRIEGDGFWRDLTTITSFHAYVSGPRTERYWYAPAAKRIVKFEGHSWVTTQFDRIDYGQSNELVQMKLEDSRP